MLDYGFLDFVLEQSWKRRLGVFVSWGSGDGGRVGDLGLGLRCRRTLRWQCRTRCWQWHRRCSDRFRGGVEVCRDRREVDDGAARGRLSRVSGGSGRAGSSQGLPTRAGRRLGGHGRGRSSSGSGEAIGGSREERWRYAFVGT